jgi:hypothetical protein
VVVVDVLFLKHDAWLRLIVNIGVVLVFAALYFRFREASGESDRLLALGAHSSSDPHSVIPVKRRLATSGIWPEELRGEFSALHPS